LHLGATQRPEQFPLLFGFDALRNGDDIARFSHSNHCLYDGERKVVVRNIFDEGLIDLDLV
jgi:hypothetical protein